MASAALTYWLHALSPLHPGAGRGDGYIDLPLVREKVTGFPFVPGSSVKGVFADSTGATDEVRRGPSHAAKVRCAAFGMADSRGKGDSANAGMLVFTDARLVCLPARSLFGTFAWCTAPLVLRRLGRDLEMAGILPPAIFPAPGPTACCVPAPRAASVLVRNGQAFLEDWDLDANDCEAAAAWADLLASRVFPVEADPWRVEFRTRFLVLPDDLFTFLSQTGTEVQAHVRIDPEQKRVADGALWYEETLPAETILAGLVWCDPSRGVKEVERADVIGLCTDRDKDQAIQVGGKATVGKGRCRLLFADVEGRTRS